MVARVLTGGSGLLLTDARCADATCTFTFDFTDFSNGDVVVLINVAELLRMLD
jgi:hypothetical protein